MIRRQNGGTYVHAGPSIVKSALYAPCMGSAARKRNRPRYMVLGYRVHWVGWRRELDHDKVTNAEATPRSPLGGL